MTILAAFVRDTLGHNISALTDLFKLLQLQELGSRLFGRMLLSAFLESEHVQLAHLLRSLLAARKLAALHDDCCVDGIEDLIIAGLDSQYTCASGATPFASAACVMRTKLGTSTTRLARAFLSGVVVAYAHRSANHAVHGGHLHLLTFLALHASAQEAVDCEDLAAEFAELLERLGRVHVYFHDAHAAGGGDAPYTGQVSKVVARSRLVAIYEEQGPRAYSFVFDRLAGIAGAKGGFSLQAKVTYMSETMYHFMNIDKQQLGLLLDYHEPLDKFECGVDAVYDTFEAATTRRGASTGTDAYNTTLVLQELLPHVGIRSVCAFQRGLPQARPVPGSCDKATCVPGNCLHTCL